MESFGEKYKEHVGLTNEDLLMVVRRYLLEKKDKLVKFKIMYYELKPLREVDDGPVGFLSDQYVLKVKIMPRKVSMECDKPAILYHWLSFFVKTLPANDYVKKFNVFTKEMLMYQFVLPRLQDIPIGIEKFSAGCYLTRKDSVLVMENLFSEGFRIAPSTDCTLDLDHLIVAMKTLARLHAASLLFEERTNISLLNHYPGYFDENSYPTDPESMRFKNLTSQVKALVEMSKKIDKYSAEEKLQIEEEMPEVVWKILEMVKPSEKYRNVLNHGDLWKNNIMFKYCDDQNGEEPTENEGKTLVNIEADEDGNLQLPEKDSNDLIGKGKPVEALLCDFQLARYAPPALDLLSLITITTDSDFRRQHLDSLLEQYFEFLCHESSNGEDRSQFTVDIISKSQFFESCEYFKLAGLIENCLFNQTILVPQEILAPLYLRTNDDEMDDFFLTTRVEMMLESFETNDIFRNRFTDALTEIIDNYVLRK